MATTVSSDGKAIEIRDPARLSVQTRILLGGEISSFSWSKHDDYIAIALADSSIHIRSIHSQKRPAKLQGHLRPVTSLSFSSDNEFLVSKSLDGTVRIWRCDSWQTVAIFDEYISRSAVGPTMEFHPSSPILATLGEQETAIRLWQVHPTTLLEAELPAASVYFTNAKIVLVGDSGVGKTALGHALTGLEFTPTESTHGRHVWQLDSADVKLDGRRKETRETLLWDLAGQPGYRVFHRQHLNEVALGLVLFDSRSETDPFAGVAYWARALDEATSGFPLVKFLVATRVDRGGPPVSNDRIQEMCTRYGFSEYLLTSARRGDGVADLRAQIKARIPWDQMPRISTPKLFYDMQDFLLREKNEGRVLQSRIELFQRFRSGKRASRAQSEAFDTCLGLTEAAGMVKRLSFGDLVLLQPEMLDDYCAWLALAARSEPDGLGFIAEREARVGAFPMDLERILRGSSDEQLLIAATVEDVVARGIALRQSTERGDMLVFPSELRTDIPDYPGTYVRSMTFLFDGPVKAIYAGLAVRLAHSPAFSRRRFFRNSAIYSSAGGETCGFVMDYPESYNDALGRLTAFFDSGCGRNTKLTFLRYINAQLQEMAFDGSVVRRRVYQCACGYTIPDEAIVARISAGRDTVICPIDERHYQIDALEEESGRMDRLVERQMSLSDHEMVRQARLAIISERESRNEFHVFLCHSSEDKLAVRVLASKLRDQGILPWLDEQEILAGKQFVSEIERVLEDVPAIAVIIGPRSFGRWQQQEYYAAVQRYVERRGKKGRGALRLIPVILPGVSEDPELPLMLRGFSRIDFRVAGGLDHPEELQRLVRSILSAHD